MKRCPKCKKQYDDSWTACLNCRVTLENAASQGIGRKQLEEARNEITDIRNIMAKLGKRVDYIEHSLSLKGEKAEPELPKDTKAEVVKEEKPTQTEKKERRKKWTENFEQALGGQWFNKLGILAVVVGIALLIGYSFKYLGPGIKISIGYAFGIGLLIFGTYLEKKKDISIYGKTLIGGGWAINYFTTFAMHHIPAVRLIESPVLGMSLLLAVSAVTVAHIYRYRSQIATAFSYLLIFIKPRCC